SRAGRHRRARRRRPGRQDPPLGTVESGVGHQQRTTHMVAAQSPHRKTAREERCHLRSRLAAALPHTGGGTHQRRLSPSDGEPEPPTQEPPRMRGGSCHVESARQKEEAPITATTIESSIAKVTNMMTNFWNLLLRMAITVTGQEGGAAGESLGLRGEG